MIRGTFTVAGNPPGYALMSVVVFVLVVVLTGVAFFSLVGYETVGAIYRQDSSEAFYLADAALERARAKFLEDNAWRDGWNGVTLGDGTYGLSVRDTTYPGEDDVVVLTANGHVGRAHRRIQALASLPPAALGLSVLVMGEAEVRGNLCLNGSVHIAGEADFGANDVHLDCGGEYTEGFPLTPPPIYTDPDHFPDATYYYVRGQRIGADYQARIFNRDGIDITSTIGDSLIQVTTYDPGHRTFKYTFDTQALVDQYFDEDTGVFRKTVGDVAVVVNFGESAVVDPPGLQGVSEVEIQGAAGALIHTTIVNTRFTGVTDEQRVDEQFWAGGLTTLKQITMVPSYGIAAIAFDFMKEGGALAQVGTAAAPALVYVTHDVESVNSNFILEGTMIVLGDWNSTGGPEITFNGEFLDNLPEYLQSTWPAGTSSVMRILNWREVAVDG